MGLAESTVTNVRAAFARVGRVLADGRPDALVATWFPGAGPPAGSVPVVRWWVGSDVLALQRGRTTAPSPDAAFNWCGSDRLAAELGDLGVQAQVVPIVPAEDPELLEFPADPAVLVYCPEGREELYGWQRTLDVAALCPGITFGVLRRSGEPPLPNVVLLGTVPHHLMRAAYLESRAVLRLTRHDGMSLSVLEALGHGRRVVWTTQMAGCVSVGQHAPADEVADLVRDAIAAGQNNAGVEVAWSTRRAADRALERALAMLDAHFRTRRAPA